MYIVHVLLYTFTSNITFYSFTINNHKHDMKKIEIQLITLAKLIQRY